MTSICPTCKKELELCRENFYPNRGQRSRSFDYHCIPCRRALSKTDYEKIMRYGREKRHNHKKFRLINRASSLKCAYDKADKKKGFIGFNLTAAIVRDFLLKPCVYCGETNLSKKGLDRLDNTKGHTIDNVVTCCYECNRARSDHFTHEEMKIIGEAIRVVKDSRIGSQCPYKTGYLYEIEVGLWPIEDIRNYLNRNPLAKDRYHYLIDGK